MNSSALRCCVTGWFLLVIFSMIGGADLRAAEEAKPTTPTAAEVEVRKLEREWLDAYEQNNAEAMDRIVAEDFVITFPGGQLQTKAQLMAMIKHPRREGAPLSRFRTEEVQSRSYGDTVILMGKVIQETEKEGKTAKEESRYTDTYVKREGRWQVVASHLSSLAPGKSNQP